jgi:hypothetical protein
MSRPEIQDTREVPTFVPVESRIRYIVARREDVWFIAFNGEEFGPYNSDREATLFAIDAAYKLGESGQQTHVVVMDESGNAVPAWTFGADQYPPRI